MMHGFRLLLLGLLTGTAACGGDEQYGNAGNTDTGALGSPRGEAVIIDVSGAYAGRFASNGAIFCGGRSRVGDPEEEFELGAMRNLEQFNIRMPRNTAPGEYATGTGEFPFDIYYTDPERVKYDEVEFATVRLESVPQAEGERLAGGIDARLSNDDNESVRVVGRLNLEAGASTFADCR